MARQVSTVVSFNAGLLSSDLDGRVDLEQYRRGLSYCENFVPEVSGPMFTRPGTRFCGAVKDAAYPVKMLRFVLDASNSYVVELGYDTGTSLGYARFWKNGALILSGGVPYTITSPYPNPGYYLDLEYVQSGDVLFLVTPQVAPYTLTRTSDTSWAFATFTTLGGPFQDVNPDSTVTMQASARTGSITVTASAATFTAADVGRKIYLEAPRGYAWPAWQTSVYYYVGNRVRSGGKTYVSGTQYYSGLQTPVHLYGTQSDGNVLWTYEDPGYGWGTITAVAAGGLTATVTVESAIPQLVVTYATNTWAFGEWYGVAVAQYPSHIAFFRDRLLFARSSDQKVWFSVTGGYNDFRPKNESGEVADDLAISIGLTGDGVNGLVWAVPMPEVILFGTYGGVHAVSETTRQEVFGPKNVTARQVSDEGCAAVNAVRSGDAVVFVPADRSRILSGKYDVDADRYVVDEITVLAKGFNRTASQYSGNAYSAIGLLSELVALDGGTPGVFFRTDSGLGGVTMDARQGVAAVWTGFLGRGSSEDIAPSVESVVGVGIDSSTLSSPCLYLATSRHTAAGTFRWIEKMYFGFGEGKYTAWPALDATVTGTATGSPAVLALGTAFAGMKVRVWYHLQGGFDNPWLNTGKEYTANGSGSVTLDANGTYTCYAGLSYHCRAQTMRLEAQDGSTVTLPRRVQRAIVRVLEQRYDLISSVDTGDYPVAVNVSTDFMTTVQPVALDTRNLGLNKMPSDVGRPRDYEVVLNAFTDTGLALCFDTDVSGIYGAPCKIHLARVYMEVGDR